MLTLALFVEPEALVPASGDALSMGTGYGTRSDGSKYKPSLSGGHCGEGQCVLHCHERLGRRSSRRP